MAILQRYLPHKMTQLHVSPSATAEHTMQIAFSTIHVPLVVDHCGPLSVVMEYFNNDQEEWFLL